MLRTAVGTARDPTASAMPEAVQAKAMPMKTPAPSMTPTTPCALASSRRPAT
jgi:hypothetical protein